MKQSPVEYWIWLQTSLGAGARTDELLSYFETPEELYNAGSKEWRLSGLLTQNKIDALKRTTPSQTGEILNECKRRGYSVITPDDNRFPKRLLNLPNMPLVIYTMGDWSVLNDPVSIGMVGTRKAGEYGIEVAQKLSRSLASAGATVVSGGALGIDSEAHAGAMLAKGRTLAFLGCGLSFSYLRENAPLRRAITRYGAVASEFPPFAQATRTTFPIRNRLISGVSLGVVVVEAGIKSGSLITANCAIEQGRDVFAVPGDIVRSSFDGAGYLIKNGAKPVFCAEDILGEYAFSYGDIIDLEKARKPLSEIEYVEYRKNKEKQPAVKENIRETSACEEQAEKGKALTDEISDNAKLIYSVLSGKEKHIDDIVRETNLKMNTVLASLTELELLGYVELVSGKKYKLI